MERKDFERMALRVNDKMREHAFPFVAAVSRETGPAEGEHLGSGLYLRLYGQTYLLTNAHVARHIQNGSLGLQLASDQNAVRITNPIQAISAPFDLALTRIDQRIWSAATRQRDDLPAERLAAKHDPVDKEFLFILGYSGERTYFSPTFQTLSVQGTPYLTQESKTPPSWLSPMHFAVPYLPDRAISMSPNAKGLPAPPGISGSPVWNTRFHEHVMQNQPWAVDDSQITGTVFGWDPASGHLLAVRIEHVRSFVLDALRKEAAYFRWINRGSPPNDALADWFAAERTIPDLR